MTEALAVKKESTALVPLTEETPEELARKEIALQAEDWEKARVEAREAGQDPDGDAIITEGLPAPFTFVRRYRGVGPLAYETKRGLIKVHSGELIIGFKYHLHDLDGNDLPEELVEIIVMSEEAFHALQDDIGPDAVPESVAVRAVRIGNERRPTPAPVPMGKVEAPKTPNPNPNPTAVPPKK